MKGFNIKQFITSFLLWFIIFYGIMAGYNYFFGVEDGQKTAPEVVTIKTLDNDVIIGNLARFTIKNDFNVPISFESPCVEQGSLQVFRKTNGQNFEISNFVECGDNYIDSFSLEPGASWAFTLDGFNNELFTEAGFYAISMRFSHGEDETLNIDSDVFEYESPGFLRQGFRTLISRPLFNLLAWFITILPNHSFGIAIIMLTLLVRLVLFLPNQKAMRSQRKLQQMQPKIDALKQKYGKNQQALAMQTMQMYKKNKINPMSSCLPMLIQMPVLLGLYYLIRDGLSSHLMYFLYPFNALDIASVDILFLGLDLNIPNIIVLPVLVAAAQWGAIRLSMVRAKKKTNEKKKGDSKDAPNQMQQMNFIMQWFMPLMIGVFTATLPAAIGIYWITSTLFGIGQQYAINHQLDKPQVRKKG